MAGRWFMNVFGVDEEPYEKFSEELTKCYNPDTGVLTTADGHNTFYAGIFETVSLEAAKIRMEGKLEAMKGKLVVKEVIDDVTALHAAKENNHATFQAASQFNTLEHTSESGRPEEGISIYSYDRTQGPACAIACAAGTLVRNYIACKDLPDRQIRNLDEVEKVLDNEGDKYFKVQNGYTLATNAKLEELNKVLENKEIGEQVKQALKQGVQWDTQVVATAFGNRVVEDRDQRVTQVYSSAVAVSYSGCRPDLWKPFALLVLKSLYMTTMYVAAENASKHPGDAGAKKVFLTAVGGGVFGNDMAWVHEAMNEAFTAFKDVDLEVYLVSYGSSTPHFDALARAFQ